MATIEIPSADTLKKIYGETEESSARYTNLAVNFQKKYHHDKAEFFTAPGRTEIIGNHVDPQWRTDHCGKISTWIRSVLLIQTEPM